MRTRADGIRETAHGATIGLLCGLIAIVQSIGFGHLLGGEGPAAQAAIGMALFSSVVLAAIVPFLSSTTGMIGVAQGIPAVALAGSVAHVTAATGGSPEVILATTVVTIAAATVFVGVASLLLGLFKLGRFIRFVPYPVVGGFLAGSGWLIARGGVEIALGVPIPNLAGALDTAMLLKTGAMLLLLATILGLTLTLRHRLVLPLTVAGAIAVFNGWAWVTGASREALAAGGWLLKLPDGGLWPPIQPGEVAMADFGAVVWTLAALPSVAILSVLALLMSTTGIELDARRDINADGELKAMGVGNIVAGLAGGSPGYQSVSLTGLALRLGGTGRIVGLTVAAMCAAALVFGDVVLSAMPTPLLGAMLVWIGGTLVADWIIRSYRRLPVREYLVILLIFVAIAIAGFAWGIVVGLIAAVLLFAVEYGRVDIVRLIVTGRDYHSSVDTSEQRRQTLLEHGDAILIIRLQGFLFFGTADGLRRRVEARATSTATQRTRFVVIDFRRVTGLDSSTVLSFVRLSQTAEREGFTVVMTGVSHDIRTTLQRGGLAISDTAAVRFADDLDTGIKWCEDRLLAEAAPDLAESHTHPLVRLLADILDDAMLAEMVAGYCDRLEIDTRAALITEGTPSDDIFFIEAGHAGVVLVTDHATPVRLATLGPGAIVGEIAFYLGEPRSASVVAEEPMIVWRFSRANMERLQQDEPKVALRFHQGIAAMLAKRLTRTNNLVRLLVD